MKRNFIKCYLSILAILLNYSILYATHISGGDLTYKPIGGNQYEITLVLYRDCAGIPIQNPETITCTSASGSSVSLSVSLIPGTGNEITFPCFGTSTTCNGGVLPGFQRYEYRGTVTLSPSSNWNLKWEDCCRNCAITTTQGGCNNSFLIEANLNNFLAPNDNSPVFTNFPVAFLCLGQNFTYNHGVLDLEGDSLVYSFINPRLSGGSAVVFSSGYSASNFLTSSTPIILNSSTGDINVTPSAFEVGITAIRIDAYRNGVWIGNVMRDIQFQVQNCSPNVLPTATGINGTNDFDTLICAGTALCFDIFTNDLNVGQNLSVTWNEGVPNATFNTTSDPFPTATFCWTPDQSDARTQPYSFTIMVKDDNCSFNAFQVYSYQIYVPFVPVDSAVTVPLCDSTERGAIYLKKSGVGEPFTYVWSDGDISSEKSNLQPGIYTVSVTNSIGCVAVKEITITPAPIKLLAFVSIVDSSSTPSSADGSLQGSASGGTPPYTYLWSNGESTPFISGLLPGVYTLTITDINGCSSLVNGVVIPKCPIAQCSGTTISCLGKNDATATVNISGNTAGVNIVWNGNANLNTPTIRNLGPGTYSVVVSNSLGCSDTCSVTIPNSPCSGFTTYTMGGYGAQPSGQNPAMYVKNNFNTVFPNGLTIGCNNTLQLTNSQAVLKFLPSSGTPSVLPSGQLVNPTGYKNTLAGQLVTTIISVGFDSSNAAFSSASGSLGSLVLSTGILRGRTVREVIDIANKHIGGCQNTYTPSQLNYVLTKINENYHSGTSNNCYLSCPVQGAGVSAKSSENIDPRSVFLDIFPNPVNNNFSLELVCIEDEDVIIEIHNIANNFKTTIFTGTVIAGESKYIDYNTSKIPSGTYIVTVKGKSFIKTKRIIVVH